MTTTPTKPIKIWQQASKSQLCPTLIPVERLAYQLLRSFNSSQVHVTALVYTSEVGFLGQARCQLNCKWVIVESVIHQEGYLRKTLPTTVLVAPPGLHIIRCELGAKVPSKDSQLDGATPVLRVSDPCRILCWIFPCRECHQQNLKRGPQDVWNRGCTDAR